MRRSPLKRTPFRGARSAPMKRTRLRRTNPERLARLRREQFGPEAEWLMTLDCCTCQRRAPSTPSHVKSRGSGGLRHQQIPQCWQCHAELEATGWRLFEEGMGIDLLSLAAEYADAFEHLPVETRRDFERKMEARIARMR